MARDSPLMWNYNDGLVMDAFTSPVDNRPYHKVCTFALVTKFYERFERGVEWGFSIAETKGKAGPGLVIILIHACASLELGGCLTEVKLIRVATGMRFVLVAMKTKKKKKIKYKINKRKNR